MHSRARPQSGGPDPGTRSPAPVAVEVGREERPTRPATSDPVVGFVVPEVPALWPLT